MSRPYETTWYGQPARALENDHLRVVVVPTMGAKIVSLYDKMTGYEWLLDPADRPFRPVPYGASFIDQDMSGWDEMFPTIVACAYPAEGPYAGASLPDHGEVWTLPWDILEDEAGLSMRVRGRALPYQLRRTMTLPEDHVLRLDYEVVNTSEVPLAGLWAAHPQFAITSTTEIRLPDDVTSVVVVYSSEELAPVGTAVDWPMIPRGGTPPVHLDRIRPATAKQSRKVYMLPDQRVSWAMLVDTASKRWLRMSWDAAQVPYLGIWVDEGEYNPEPTVALEPSTGYYDSLEWAWKNERVPILAPGEHMRWSITVAVGAE